MSNLERLYNDPKLSDNIILISTLNRIFETSLPERYLSRFQEYITLLEQISSKSPITRSDILYLIVKVKPLFKSPTIVKVVQIAIDADAQINETNLPEVSGKYLWMLSICRAVFDKHYAHNISYSNNNYTLREAAGEEPWVIFLDAAKAQEPFVVK